ncbi:hypothetical protein MVEN_00722700 [Mycena venus]|uniref:Uncharacterized protein n=1 Tax=Mycena venus TaxID=2733690 RepID=A0A8H6YF12_9AGAR|nr:hypothetical protein MVEN_00722700 [Mycena venus]
MIAGAETTLPPPHPQQRLQLSTMMTAPHLFPSTPRSAFAGGARVAYDPCDVLLEASEEACVAGVSDNMSYALRGSILIELALRKRIGAMRYPGRKRSSLHVPDRPVTVISTRQTGETLLDETLKIMKQTKDAG